MISVDEALSIIRLHARSFGVEEIPFEQSGGRVLAEDIHADRDFPAFHRATMDGIVIKWEDWMKGIRSFRVIGEQLAGEKQQELSNEATCLEIMTGAVVSAGGDVVIRYEDVTITDGQAHVSSIEANQWMNIHKQGTDAEAGEVLIPSDKRVNPGDIGIFASVGKGIVRVKKLPKVAIISTGDELVPVVSIPADYQIRKSNSFVLGELASLEGLSFEHFHLRDDEAEIRRELTVLLDHFDVILLSGGVSKGKRDYVPEMLAELGVEMHFHGVQQRPGKPLWFGSTDRAVVFGFPGNPVSTVVCFLVYFREWLRMSLGYEKEEIKARLTTTIHFKPSLSYFVPVQFSFSGNELLATPFVGHGSGDLVNLSNADGFIRLPSDKEVFEAREVFEVVALNILYTKT